MNRFPRLLSYAVTVWPGLLVAFAVAFSGMVLELLRPWPLKVVVDYVLGGQDLPGMLAAIAAALPYGDTTEGLLAWTIGTLVVITLASAVLTYIGTALVVKLCYRLVHGLAGELFAKLQRLSLSYHQKQAGGDLIQRMSQDVYCVHMAVSAVLLPGVISLCTLVAMFVILAQIDVTLALMSMVVVPGLAGTLLLFAGPMDRATRRRYDELGSFMSFVDQAISGIKVVQGFNRENLLQAKLQGYAQRLGGAYQRDVNIGAAYKQVTLIVTGLSTAAVLGLGAWRVIGGHISLGDLLVFTSYLAALSGPIEAISVALGAAVVSGSQARRVFEVLDSGDEVPERADPIDPPAIAGDLRFEDVSFSYVQAGDRGTPRTVLDHVSFTASPGEIIAIVGATGMGKSTLVSLISRFYDPDSGRVLLDGHDLRDLPLRKLRSSVSLVLQEPYLFPVSIAENIAFGVEEASLAQIHEAAKMACAHDFISRLPLGYATNLGESGSSLSGGERQRIAIARAMLRPSSILILDEPTSALDARTEAQILQNLAESARARTTFFISHRLSTIKHADKIIVLEDGRLVEAGKHEELIGNGATYSALYRHQELAVL